MHSGKIAVIFLIVLITIPFTNAIVQVKGNPTDTFLKLFDTPNSYSGSSNDCVKVNAGATALIFTSCGGGGDFSFTDFQASFDLNNTVNVGGNASWNQSLANTLYANITWNYNQSDGVANPFDQDLNISNNVTFKKVNITKLLSVLGNIELETIPISNNERAIKIDIDAGGFADLSGVEIDYVTGNTADGDSNAAFLVNVDDTASTGGYVHGFHMRAVAGGSSSYHALHVGVGVTPIHQDTGTFANPTTGTDNTADTDVADMIDGNDGTTTSILSNDNEYIIIGAASAYEEMSVSLTTGSSANLKLTYWYSTAGTGQFTQFTPIDGTDGFKKTGVVTWNNNQFTGHVADDLTGTFDIKIIRTKNNVVTNPILGFIKSAIVVNYHWRPNGDIEVNGGKFDGLVNVSTSAFISDNVTVLEKTCFTSDCSKYMWYNGSSLIIQG